MHVIVDDLLINYQQTKSSNNKNILFLHGWGDNIKGQSKFIDSLSDFGNVTAVDLPGFGESQIMNRDWTLLDYAKFVADFVAKINLNKVDVLIGHSNGGSIAIKLLATDKLKPKKLILVASAGIRGENKTKYSLLKVATKTGKAITSPMPKSVKSKMRSKLYKSIGSDLLVADNLEGTFKQIINEDLRHEAEKIDIPTLLIYGQDDHMTPVKFGRIYHEAVNGSTLELVGSAGHFVQFDQPAIVNNLIRDFIS
jgi:pimeloyl-ACP methyl ester carboxylesterase